ncbi:MAG: PEP-CTERM sorting domain-containing protein [Isosphaeraceae bacterium]
MTSRNFLRGTALVAALGMALGWCAGVEAGYTYAYSQQTVNGLVVGAYAPGGGALTGAVVVNSGTSDAAAFVTGVGNTGGDNVPQATVGTVVAPEDSYFAAGPGNQIPAGPITNASFARYGPSSTLDFSRGDALITNSSNLFSTGVNAANVAESNLGGVGNPIASASAHWSIVGHWTYAAGTGTTANQQITVGFQYANALVVDSNSGGVAHADYNLDISLSDITGGTNVVVWHYDPVTNNHGGDFPPPEDIVGSGLIVVDSLNAGTWESGVPHNLVNGHVYQISISGGEATRVVPEPASLVLIGMGLSTIAGLACRRRLLAGRN